MIAVDRPSGRRSTHLHISAGLSLSRRAAARARRHPLGAGVLALVAVLVGWMLSGAALQSWAIGLGMDEQRGALIAALLVVCGGATIATLLVGHAAATRCGALLGLCAVEIGPFIVDSTRAPVTPGLTAHVVPGGWVAQPVGMLLLGWIVVTAGSALGTLLRSDAVAVWSRLRGRRLLWLALVPAVVALTVGWR
ncbi:MAG: hypothetical protein ACREQ5_29265, partial [Candidatus Dormibacteria bacterium]